MSNAILARVFAAGAVTGLVGFLARWALQKRRAATANPATARLSRYADQQHQAWSNPNRSAS